MFSEDIFKYANYVKVFVQINSYQVFDYFFIILFRIKPQDISLCY